MRLFFQISIPAALLLPSSANAHGFHLADLAGHTHWVGLAALLAAGVVAAASRKKPKRENAANDEATEAKADAQAEKG